TAQMPVAIALKTGPQLQVLGGNTQKLAVAPMHESVATFRGKATGTLGPGALIFTASRGGKPASQRIDVSVRPAAAYRAQVGFSRLAPHTARPGRHPPPMA